METNKEKIMRQVNVFMDEWFAYAKNQAAVNCPVPFLHENDKEYYCKRILRHHEIAALIDDHNYEDLTELHIMQNKYVAIENDFEQLYRKVHNMQR